MNNELLTNMGLKINATSNTAPYIKVEIKGDYNDGDYITSTTKFDMSKPVEVTRITSLVNLLRMQSKGDCIADYLDDTEFECPSTCDECPHYNREYMSDEELVIQIQNLVDLPMGPYGICHTLLWINLSYVDEMGREFELVDSADTNCKWGFPIYCGTSHY